MFPPQSTPSKRPKRRVESYRIYKRSYSACSQSSRPSPSSYEKATHGRLVGPTLSTPRGDNNYNQYRPLCEVCPRDRDKVVGTLQGSRIWDTFQNIKRGIGNKRPPALPEPHSFRAISGIVHAHHSCGWKWGKLSGSRLSSIFKFTSIQVSDTFTSSGYFRIFWTK